MKVTAAAIILAVIAVANAQEGAGKPNKKTDYLRALQDVEATSVLSTLSLSFPAGIEGPVVDVADVSVQSKAGKTESPTFYPTMSSAPTVSSAPSKEVCTIPGGKSGKSELYCLGKLCGICAGLEAAFIAGDCTSLIAQPPPDECVSLDDVVAFATCAGICADYQVCDPLSIPTIAGVCNTNL